METTLTLNSACRTANFQSARYIILALLILFSVGFSMHANAQPASSPVNVIQTTSDQVLAQLRAKKSSIGKNPQIAYNIITRVAVPHFDKVGMTRSVLGRNNWRKANKTQRQQFVKEFTAMVTRSYAKALSEYTNETVKVHPLRGSYANKKRVKVKSTIIRPGAPSIPVSYSLVRTKTGWKIYDFSVEGVSMLRSLRNQFDAQIASKGLDGTLQTLRKHNRGRQ